MKKIGLILAIFCLLVLQNGSVAQTSNCLAFDGADDYVNLGVMDANAGFSSGFTFEAWVKWNAFVAGARLIDFGDPGNQNNIIIRTQNSSGWIRTEIYNSGSNSANDMAENLIIGKWYHIAVTVGGGNVKIYLDGVQKVSASTNAINNANRSNCFLGKSNWADPYFPGLMDEVRIWKVVRTPEQIVSDMYNPVYFNENGLYRYFRFNQGVAGSVNTSITQLQDLSINNKPGTLSNFALTGATSNWVVGYSYPMVLKVNTALGDASNTITLPLNGIVNVLVDWGDGGSENFSTAGLINHTYTSGGVYNIKIDGILSQFGNGFTPCPNIQKITNAYSFGELSLISLLGAFYQASNLSSVPNYLPPTITDLSGMFAQATSFNQDLNSWNTSNVTAMPWMFSGASSFNGNISNWNVSSVTNMYNMFPGATAFNADISNWNVGNVTDMEAMFYGASSFNRNIGNWNVTNVTNLRLILGNAYAFNQDISNWNIINCSNMELMLMGVTLSPEYYSKMLLKWSKLPVQSSVLFSAGNSKYYTAAEDAKLYLYLTKLWTITDGGSIVTPINFGVEAYYPFNGNTNDESGNGHNASVNGANLSPDRFNKIDNAYAFNGIDQSINTGVGSGLTNTISICAWFKSSTPKNFDPILVLRNGAYDVVGLYASTWGADGVVSFDFSDGSFKNVYANDKNYCDGNWHLAVGTFDGNTAKIYIDGVLKQTNNTPSSLNFSSTFVVGYDNSSFYEGQIDDIRIYNRTLNDADVLQLYQSAPGVSTNVVSNITYHSAMAGGNVFFNSGTPITAKGVCWSTSPNPSIDVNNGLTDEGTGEGIFSSTITGLLADTTYYVRAYATNTLGTNYGEQISFKTSLTPPGNALSFDGTNDFIRLPYSTTLCLAQSNFSIEAWINIADNSYRQVIAHNALGCHSWQGWELSIGSQDGVSAIGKAVFSFNYNNSATYFEVVQTEPIATNRWVHLAGTYDGSNLKLYVDGVLNNSVPASGIPWTSDNPVSIGADPGCGIRYALNGKIDELRIWNTTRTSNEIQDNFSTPFNGNESGLLAYFNFDQGIAEGFNINEDKLTDLSSNHYDGTLYNFRLYSDTSNWVESYAMVVPNNVYATNITPYGFKVNWDAPTFGIAENYTLQISQTNDFSSILQTHNNILDNFLIVSGLNPSSQYFFRVRANKPSINANGAYTLTESAITLSDAICFAGIDTTICSKTYQMQAANPNPYSGSWMCITGQANIESFNNPSTIVSNLKFGANIFVWEVDGLRDTVIINCTVPSDINEQGVGAYNLNDTVCSGGFSEINIIFSQVGVSYQLLKDGVPYLAPLDGNGNVVSFLLSNITSSNSYSIIAKNIANACQITMNFSANIHVIQPPAVNLGSDLTVCKGANVSLIAGNKNSNNYIWSNSTTSSAIQINNILTDGIYWVAVSNICGTAQDTISIQVSIASLADFTVTSMSSNSFNFTNLTPSTANLWNFGNGVFSNAISPQYTFNNEGFYNVCLSVADLGSGCNSTKCQVVESGSNISSCHANFTWTESGLNEILFNSSSSMGNLTNFYWRFGDGTFSFQANPNKTYTYPGMYNVQLTVYDTIGGCMNNYQELITVGDVSQDCESDFIYYTESSNTWAYFTVTTGLGNNFSYTWNFGDGSTSNDMNAVHTYSSSGSYNVCLSIYNNINGCSDITCKNVLIGDSVLNCSNNFSYMVYEQTKANSYPVSYKGAAFGDPAKDWTMHWDFGDGGTAINVLNPIYEYSQPGYFLTMFRINNGSNSCTSTFYDIVNVMENEGIYGNYGYEIDSNFTKANSYPVTYKGAAFGDPARLTWTFGDGTSDSTTMNPTHEYASQGTYNVCLTVSNPAINQSHTICKDVEVYDYTKTKEQTSQASPTINIIPNPGNGTYQIKLYIPEQQKLSIEVFDVYGKNVKNIFNQLIQQGSYEIPFTLSNNNKGVFYLRLQNNRECRVIRFINL